MKSICSWIVLLFVCIMLIGCGEMDNIVGSVVPVEDGKDGTSGRNGSDGTNGSDGATGVTGATGTDGVSSVVKLLTVSMPDCNTVKITVEKIGPNLSYIVTVDVYGTIEAGQAPYTSHNIDVAVDNEFRLKTVGVSPFYVVIDGTDGMSVNWPESCI